jgi:polygalacturonase
MKIINKINLIVLVAGLIISNPVCCIAEGHFLYTCHAYNFIKTEENIKPVRVHRTCFPHAIIFNVKDYGATGDGSRMDTRSINRAIDSCSKAGGGIVYFPPGNYLSGSIHLKSNITLYLDSGAIIKGAGNDIHAYDKPESNIYDTYQDFGHSHWHNALMWGEGLSNIKITGKGIIDGGGITSSNRVPEGGGDKILSLKQCNDISLSGITLIQGGHFAVLATGCKGMDIYNVTIRTGRDGIDLMQCSYVNIYNCDILSARYENGQMAGGDDAIGIKSDYSLGHTLPSHNIYIRNCRLGSAGANGIQFGSETVGNISNVHISDCKIVCAGKAGIGITSNDGSVIENVSYSNINMQKVGTPFFILISDRLRAGGHPHPGQIKNITFNHITATDVFSYEKKHQFTSTILGMPEHPVSDVYFNDITIIYKGGGTAEQSKIIPPVPADYSPRYVGVRPSYGFYCRNIKRIEFHNIDISYEKTDYRPGFIFKNIDGLIMDSIKAEHPS